MSEPINRELRKHATRTANWPFAQRADWLHEWAARFIQHFDLLLETPAINLDQIHWAAMGSYRRGRNGFGLRHAISINTRYLADIEAEVLDTLLHEMLHEWQDLHGKPSRSNYHNMEFRKKARSLGLHIDSHGRTSACLPGPFTDLLEDYGVSTKEYLDRRTAISPKMSVRATSVPAEEHPTGENKMRKWSCGCTNIRAAVEIQARCLKCGNVFERAAAAW